MADENKNPLFGDFGKMPSFDFTKLMKDFKLPGVDLATIMDREKKNTEGLLTKPIDFALLREQIDTRLGRAV